MNKKVDIVIQQFIPENISDWLRLRQLLWPDSSIEKHQREAQEILDSKDTPVFLAHDSNGKIVGFIELSIRNVVQGCQGDRVGYIEGIFVENAYRQNGVAKMLVDKGEQWAKALGCREMASDTEISNEVSLLMHEHLGYKETERLVHFHKSL